MFKLGKTHLNVDEKPVLDSLFKLRLFLHLWSFSWHESGEYRLMGENDFPHPAKLSRLYLRK